MTQTIKIGCEGFVVRDNKVLLLKRGSVDGEGTWSLPGGHLEYMERIDEGLIRELKEELDLDVSSSDLVLMAVADDLRPHLDQHYLHMTFMVSIGDQEPKCMEPDKCAELKWYPIDAIPRDIFPFHAKIFATLKSQKIYLPNQA